MRIREEVSCPLILGGTVKGDGVLLVEADFEEILDVGGLCAVFVNELLAVPDRTVNLSGTIKLRTPGTVLNECLGTVPALTEVVLEDGKEGNLTEFDATAVLD